MNAAEQRDCRMHRRLRKVLGHLRDARDAMTDLGYTADEIGRLMLSEAFARLWADCRRYAETQLGYRATTRC
jgi:hypothetical protein